MMQSTASPLELLGVVINALGIVCAWWMLMLTKARYDAVLQTGGTRHGPRILIAWRHFRCEGARIAYHVVTLGMGVWAMQLPDGGSSFGHVAMVVRVAIGGLFTLCSVLDLLSDNRLAGLLSETPPPRGTP
jgi:hypothetical protein